MFQASINDLVIAEANTRTELAAQVAHEVGVGRLYDPETGIKVALDDCKIVELAAFEAQAKEARQYLGLGAAHEMLWRCDGGLTLSALEKFCTDGHTDNDDLAELAYAFDQAGATKAAAICRNHMGL